MTLPAGIDYFERREILARMAHVCLVIEGGPNTWHEVTVAADAGIPVIPLGRTGGCAGDVYSQLVPPVWAPRAEWEILGSSAGAALSVAAAICTLIESALSTHTSLDCHPPAVE